MLAETATTEISKKRQPKNFPANQQVAKEGGNIAAAARKQIEAKTGQPVISDENFQVRRRKLLGK
jgi:hypothetical protein